MEFQYNTICESFMAKESDEKEKNQLKFLGHNGEVIGMSYEELRHKAVSIAKEISSFIDPHDRVILSVTEPSLYIPFFWAILISGGTVVPFFCSVESLSMKNDADANKLKIITRISKANSIIVTEDKIDTIEEIIPNIEIKSTDEILSSVNRDDADYEKEPRYIPKVSDLAMILFTSGSTGDPKGVPFTHGKLLKGILIDQSALEYTDKTRFFNWFPMEHVAPLNLFHILPLLLRAEQVHIKSEEVLQDPKAWLKFLDKFKPSVTWAPDSIFSVLIRQREEIDNMDIDLSSLREIINAGEMINYRNCKEFLEIIKNKGCKEVLMLPFWGMTEAVAGITITRAMRKISKGNIISVGKAIDGFQLRIVDDQGEVINEEGVEGEVQVKGEPIFDDYINDDINGEFQDGWFITGDIGSWISGELVLTGRSFDRLIVNGVNYSVPAINQKIEEYCNERGYSNTICAIASINEDSRRDELIIFIEVENENKEIKKDLYGLIREGFKSFSNIMCKEIVFVPNGEIPRTSIGKIKKKDLHRRFREGFYEENSKDIESKADKHREPGEISEEERLLGLIFSEVLNIKEEGLNHSANFFEIGGTSVLVPMLLKHVLNMFKVKISPMEFVENADVKSLMSFINYKKADMEDMADISDIEEDLCEVVVI